MRVCVQRVRRASVTIADEIVGQIERGLVVLVGFRDGDDDEAIDFLTEKILHLRIFPDDDDKMNRSLLDVGAALLVVSQFTLYGDCRKGRRPSFIEAARPEVAIPLYERFVARLRSFGVNVETGKFGANMDVALINEGPVTLVLDSP